jgi:hypothetical protein
MPTQTSYYGDSFMCNAGDVIALSACPPIEGLPAGAYEQIGTAITSGSGAVEITLPTAYGTALLNVQATPLGDVTGLDGLSPAGIAINSPGAFTVSFNKSGSGAANVNFYWRAVGY